ncbi:DNA polymerase family B-domain-containing protein [Ochromonadaceae sp. CCMP2298]|nr:DNA polymerase family B-domain-containing protein [Ochromonadaceae sp. CCMP2298]
MEYEVIDGADGPETVESQEARWARPARAQKLDPSVDSLPFQWLDLDMTSGDPMHANPDGKQVIGSLEGPVPIVRMYGVTADGQSVMANVHGFTPYFYVSFPASVELSNALLGQLRAALDQRCRDKARGEEKNLSKFVLGVEKTEPMQSLLGYHFDQVKEFVKVFMAMPSLLPGVKRLLEEGVQISGAGMLRGQTYESNVPYVLRFMIDNEISGADWVELPAGTYSVRGSGAVSRCSVEVDVFYNNIKPHECVGVWSSIAPLRILSFDIECQGRKGHFPDAAFDPVIQIANTITLQGSDVPIIRNVFTLNTCLPIVGAQVICCATEEELLLKWRAFVNASDPDMFTGYNIANFDFPYLLNRAKALEKASPALKRFPDIGRLKGIRAVMRETTFQSSAYGKRENVETAISGRVVFDLLPYMFRNHKLSSYSLNSVSSEFLGQQKEDVHYSIISDLQNGSDADRRRLAVYCLKDAYLPQQLMNKLAIVVNYIEMARVTGVPLNFILTRGQQIKVFSMLLRKTRKVGLLIPNLAKHGADSNDTYEGATVIEPKKAYYEVPIATLDFASLYPSIMQGYNLCYSTLVNNQDVSKLSEDAYERSPAGHVFVRATTKKGILPQILDELLAARKRAKKDMAAATDPMVKAVQNGRQMALKVSANSVYGFTGATVGQLPCLAIASSVTSYGRNLLLATRSFVESKYTIENGYEHNAEVVYGDTDSVMIKFGPTTVAEAMPMAEKAAAEVSAIFPDPIKLEFEKVYFPYLLMNKKRYAGLLWTRPDKYDKLDAKGLETVRRDNCLLVRKVVDTCLRKIIIDRDVQGAIDYAKGTISDLLQNKMDISMLVITKSLGKSADDADYANKQAHVELAMRMRKRDPGSAPNVGDRVAYVIIQAAKGAPAYEKSEDPVWVLDHNLPIDTEYYLTNQLSNPLVRIFEPIIPNPQSLISGDHTRAVCKPTPKGGGIMAFAVKKETCMGCRTLVAPQDKVPGTPLCRNCGGKEGEVYAAKLSEVNLHQRVFNQLWTECQRCQGSFHQEVICSNRDCPIFYKRKKVQIDLQKVQDELDKFAW